MADDLRDDDVSASYRELRRPEPPRALDDAILAASRRAVGARPGGADGGRRGSPTARWALPASVAAVLALSVMVTLHVQEELPGLEAPAPTPRAAPEAKREAPTPVPGSTADATPAQAPQEKLAAKEPAPPQAAPAPATSASRAAEAVARRDSKAATERAAVASNAGPRPAEPTRDAVRTSPGFASDPPTVATAPAIESSKPARPQPVVAQAPAAPAVPATQSAAVGASAAPPPPAPAVAAAPAARELRARGELSRDDGRPAAKLADASESPGKQLERIAQLRKDGRHAEADQLLKEFRARHPGYRIPEAMLERVEPPR